MRVPTCTVAFEASHFGALVDADPTLEELRAKPEHEAGGLYGRVEAIHRAAEKERRGAASSDLVGRHRHHLLRRTESRGGVHDLVPRADLRLGGRHPQHRRLSVPGVDLVHLAPGADPAHGVLRRAADGERGSIAGRLAKRRRVAPERFAEAAVSAARAATAYGCLQHDDV